MKQLTRAQYFFLGSMLFGMMFGAGNLIFPVHLGQLAGSHFWLANWGFISTGVFMPFIGLIALGISGATSVEDLANRIHPTFSKIFTVLLYLTIGPCFALPRTASVSFQIGWLLCASRFRNPDYGTFYGSLHGPCTSYGTETI